MKKITLGKGKEKPLVHRHPWIFSGAIAAKDEGIEDGQIVSVFDWRGSMLGYGYYNSRSQIIVRMLSFGSERIDTDFYRKRLILALDKRLNNPLLRKTNAFRLVFSEGDFLPGLIIDKYDAHLVVQVLTMGIERIRDSLLEMMIDIFSPQSIFERSDHHGRLIEGMEERSGQLFGITPDNIIINEDGILLHVDVRHGQKTGLFLDQRENRELVRELAPDRNVLDLFCYSGGFSMAALKGGAKNVISVDASENALDMVKRNARLNDSPQACSCVRADIFDYLRREEINSDLIIIDPPALAKSRSGISNACRGYKDLNLQAIKKAPPGALILSCSCSRFISLDLFQKVLFSAASDAVRNVSIIRKACHPADHPVSIFHPESEYLKSILLQIE